MGILRADREFSRRSCSRKHREGVAQPLLGMPLERPDPLLEDDPGLVPPLVLTLPVELTGRVRGIADALVEAGVILVIIRTRPKLRSLVLIPARGIPLAPLAAADVAVALVPRTPRTPLDMLVPRPRGGFAAAAVRPSASMRAASSAARRARCSASLLSSSSRSRRSFSIRACSRASCRSFWSDSSSLD
jgi:hypothetical protein